VILRHATDDDPEALNSFDVGDTSIPWLAEVAGPCLTIVT
jgi:hypothetical protein